MRIQLEIRRNPDLDVLTVGRHLWLHRLVDAAQSSESLSIGAMLAKTDGLPLLLGWSGCLDRARLLVDAPSRQACLEF